MNEADINHLAQLIYELGLEPESRHKRMCKLAWRWLLFHLPGWRGR
ncbi:MAG: hypothetical protein H6R08_784 [Proteobacteria bacterium]|jgi:phage terminase small subunit|nr:hypothetical protein [Pseudomonadota bacterium]